MLIDHDGVNDVDGGGDSFDEAGNDDDNDDDGNDKGGGDSRI